MRLCRFRQLIVLATLSTLVATGASVAAAVAPTVEDFFGPSFLRHAAISPDGTRVAGVATWEKDLGGLIVHELATQTTNALKGDERLDVRQVFWHGDDRLIFTIVQDKLYSRGLYSVPVDDLSRHVPIRLFDAIELIGQPVARPDRVILWVRQAALEEGKPGSVHEISVHRPVAAMRGLLEESSLRTLPAPSETILGYLADGDGEVAFAIVGKDGLVTYRYWDHATSAWKNPPAGLEERLPLARDYDPDFAWIVTRDAVAGSQLRRMRLATGELEEPVHEDKHFDLNQSRLSFSRLTREFVGVDYHRQRTFSRWLSPKFAGIQALIDASLPKDEDHVLLNWNDAETRFVIRSTGPRSPAIFRVLDVETGQLSQFGESRPTLAGHVLQPSKAIKFTARDGLALEGYLTTPPNRADAKPVPLVVLVHGGPKARDTAEFDPEVQFLVSRGYAVLQPNYRGSSGYLWPEGTDDYRNAFEAMRDDVIDATRAALKTGRFDPARVAIMGGSFGGYLSLACPVEEPDLFRCAISVCGVFDWADHVESKRRANRARPGEYERLVRRFGDPRKNEAAYDAISPLRRVDSLRIPMLVAHGKSDSIVSIQQSRRLIRELKKRKLPHETFFRPVAGHGFYAARDSIDFYHTLERFLATHLD